MMECIRGIIITIFHITLLKLGQLEPKGSIYPIFPEYNTLEYLLTSDHCPGSTLLLDAIDNWSKS